MPRILPEDWRHRRQRFLDAAWRCAARSGLRELTVEEVCREANSSKGAFYVYFGSKHELLVAMLEEDARRIDAMVRALTADDASLTERLDHFVRVFIDRASDQNRAQARADLWAECMSDLRLRRHAASVIQRRHRVLCEWLRGSSRSGEADEYVGALSSLILATADGLMLHAGLDGASLQWPPIRQQVHQVAHALGVQTARRRSA